MYGLKCHLNKVTGHAEVAAEDKAQLTRNRVGKIFANLCDKNEFDEPAFRLCICCWDYDDYKPFTPVEIKVEENRYRSKKEEKRN